MTPKFTQLVSDMRQAQKRYFKEKQVDLELAFYKKPLIEQLYGDDDNGN